MDMHTVFERSLRPFALSQPAEPEHEPAQGAPGVRAVG